MSEALWLREEVLVNGDVVDDVVFLASSEVCDGQLAEEEDVAVVTSSVTSCSLHPAKCVTGSWSRNLRDHISDCMLLEIASCFFHPHREWRVPRRGHTCNSSVNCSDKITSHVFREQCPFFLRDVIASEPVVSFCLHH